ncbi:lysozyme-like protein [Mycena amicta]|nr:lysozyme-like protein [Mycena amicta]
MMLALPLLLLGVSLAVHANIPHDHNQLARHHKLARNPAPVLETPVQLRKRKSCQAPSTKTTSTHHTSSHTSTKKKTSTTAKPKATSKSTSNTNNAVSIPGTIKVQVSRCGNNGATTKISKTAGPNGSLEWLNCGLTSGGWNPPFIRVQDVQSTDLATALKSSSSPFHACAAYVDYFYEAADKYGLKPIMLAAFAMQESSCNKNTVGGGGEQGLMQISKDKCGGAPDGNCKDPKFNIDTGARYFADTLNGNGGDLLLSLGEYNGWYKGLTVAKATAARHSDCCLCQNNLDYLFQWMNGWILNQNAYSLGLGQFFNLAVCGDD